MQTGKTFSRKLLALVLGIVLLSVAFSFAMAGAESEAASLVALTNQATDEGALDSPFKAVYNEASQSVVGIQLNLQRGVVNGRIFNNSSFVGSGVVIKDGVVLTNYHVVTSGGSEVMGDISVVYDGEEYSTTYLAGDAASDIAVLEVEGLPAPAAKIGNSEELSVGDWALVIGNPLGETFANTLTVGVISGVNRSISSRNPSTGAAQETTMIQTDAAINSGNSGGGLFNIRGELVGITSMKLSGRTSLNSAYIEGFGFAIPINEVAKVADDLIDYGEVKVEDEKYPRIGVTIQTLESESDEPTGEFMPSSVWVRQVEKDAPADLAGIRVDDLIVEADGTRVKTTAELSDIVRSHEDGDIMQIKVYRYPSLRSITMEDDLPEGEYITFDVQVTVE